MLSHDTDHIFSKSQIHLERVPSLRIGNHFQTQSGGAKRKLSNLFEKRTDDWDKGHYRNSIPATKSINNSRETRNEDQFVASAVKSKLDAGNFKAALRILCTFTCPTKRHHTSNSCRQTPETSRRSTNTNRLDRQHKIHTAADHPRRRQEDLTHLSSRIIGKMA